MKCAYCGDDFSPLNKVGLLCSDSCAQRFKENYPEEFEELAYLEEEEE
jgi:hypothetical protein